ncbi:hypothetical protein BGZ97_007859, partial [Linnemannia gamsii]
METSKVPPGLVDDALDLDAFDLIVTSSLDTSAFHKHNLTTQINSPSRLALFRQSLTSNFNAAWDHAVSSQRAAINTSTEPQQPTRTTEEISAVMEKDAKDRATKRLRTINVQLKDIVRADLLTEIVDDERTDE